MTVRTALRAIFAPALLLEVLALPAAAQTIQPPKSALFRVNPGATSTLAPIEMQDGTGQWVPIGSLNPTAHAFAPANALQSANNLSDLASAATARTNLGLGALATLGLSSVLQPSNNLSDLASPSSARTALGLGGLATLGLSSNLAFTGANTHAGAESFGGGLTVNSGLTSSNASQLLVQGTYAPASGLANAFPVKIASTINGPASVTNTVGGLLVAVDVTSAPFGINNISSQVVIDPAWSGANPIHLVSNFNPETMIDTAKIPITYYQEYASTPFACQDGQTYAGTVGCSGMTLSGFTGGAGGSGTTLVNEGLEIDMSSGASEASGATTINYGLHITRDVATGSTASGGTTTSYAIYDDAADPIYLAATQIRMTALPTSAGTVKGTLCVDTTGSVYAKTTTGACL